MTEPTRWTGSNPPTDPQERRAAELLESIIEAEPWDELKQARLRKRMLAAVPPPRAPRRGRTVALGGVAAAMLGATVVAALLLRSERRSDLPAHVTSSADTQVQFTLASRSGESDRLELTRGRIEVTGADPERGLLIRAPHLAATVRASSYVVEVAGEQTLLAIGPGEAWVGEVLRVHLLAGQSIRSDDARLLLPSAAPVPLPDQAAPTPSATPDRVARCAERADGDARQACYRQLAIGNDQAAQNALFELGVLESEERHDGPSAIATWRDYQRRFPEGALGPEASFSVLSELLAERQAANALTEARAFLSRYPSDSRSDEVRLAAASLACAVDTEPAQALALVEVLLSRPNAPLRGEALFVKATCQRQLGRTPEAHVTERTYLTELPRGPHAAEVRSRLAPTP